MDLSHIPEDFYKPEGQLFRAALWRSMLDRVGTHVDTTRNPRSERAVAREEKRDKTADRPWASNFNF